MMAKMDIVLFHELINYWLNDLVKTSYVEGYMSSSYEVGGIEGNEAEIAAAPNG